MNTLAVDLRHKIIGYRYTFTRKKMHGNDTQPSEENSTAHNNQITPRKQADQEE